MVQSNSLLNSNWSCKCGSCVMGFHYPKGKLRNQYYSEEVSPTFRTEEASISMTTKYGQTFFQQCSQGRSRESELYMQIMGSCAPYISDSDYSFHPHTSNGDNYYFCCHCSPTPLPTLHRKCQESLWVTSYNQNWNMCDLRFDAFQNIGVTKAIGAEKRNRDWKSIMNDTRPIKRVRDSIFASLQVF